MAIARKVQTNPAQGTQETDQATLTVAISHGIAALCGIAGIERIEETGFVYGDRTAGPD
ncbi:hypothetical protein [Laspinema olomoucense]|uniref:Uncharacterized protein n=1 Tax=Laspinema olomoucense D3b TaxID=2953688 RepID=A0ABT2N4L6_9CYAN|nr:hypothetical protein [Laspinema sp. D3b]MCT7977620.1 hypothetical protein [Laspinema sp. D3b]